MTPGKGFYSVLLVLQTMLPVLAERLGIKSYSLSRMNDRISSVLSSRYAGPPGDIFSGPEILMRFLAQLLPRYLSIKEVVGNIVRPL